MKQKYLDRNYYCFYCNDNNKSPFQFNNFRFNIIKYYYFIFSNFKEDYIEDYIKHKYTKVYFICG